MAYFQTNKWSTAKKCVFEGQQYDSIFEAGYARELALRVRAGEITRWDPQVNLDLIVNGRLVCHYRIDFIAFYPDGTIEYIETKGYASPLWRLKWKLFEACYSNKPNARFLVVKQKENFKLRKLKKI